MLGAEKHRFRTARSLPMKLRRQKHTASGRFTNAPMPLPVLAHSPASSHSHCRPVRKQDGTRSRPPSARPPSADGSETRSGPAIMSLSFRFTSEHPLTLPLHRRLIPLVALVFSSPMPLRSRHCPPCADLWTRQYQPACLTFSPRFSALKKSKQLQRLPVHFRG